MDKEILDKARYSTDQLQEIEEGKSKRLDVSAYQNPDFLAIQMREIRIGLEAGLDVSRYADTAYDWFQMREIRKGLEEKLNVEKYADPEIPFDVMRQIRKGLVADLDISFAKKAPAGILREIRKAILDKIDIQKYVIEGYDEKQLRQVRIAKEKGIDIDSHIKVFHRAHSIREIALGLEKGLDVSVYEDVMISWQQMREIRLGMEEGVDVSRYSNPLYSWKQMHEIRLGMLDNLPVDLYSSLMYTAKEMEKKRKKLLEERRHPETAQKDEVYKDFSLLISADKMEAFILLREKGRHIGMNRLLSLLKEKGVKSGIDYDMLEYLEKQGADNNMVILARGKRPEDGADGWYEFFFDTNIKKEPKMLEDGSVDYQNIKWFEIVKKGDVVARYHEPELGKTGRNIMDEEVPAKKGRELKYLTCKGVTLQPDKKTYVADTDGKIEYKCGGLEITNILILDRVTQATGNVQFNGSVYVRGEVGDGTVIRAEQDILVDGFLGAASLEAGGDIILRKGNNGGDRGRLKAQGSVMGRFFERANVKAGKHINANYCLNSELWADGHIEIAGKNGILAGGNAFAAKWISAFNIGNAAGIITGVSVGGEAQFITENNMLEENLRSSQRELELLKNIYMDFQRKYPPEVRNSSQRYLKVENAIYIKNHEIDNLHRKQKELMKGRALLDQTKIVIRGNLYQGVNVNINGSIWNAKTIKNVTLKKKDGSISVFRNVVRRKTDEE